MCFSDSLTRIGGPESCALASVDSTRASIQAEVKELLLALYDPYYSELPKDLSRSSSVKGLQTVT